MSTNPTGAAGDQRLSFPNVRPAQPRLEIYDAARERPLLALRVTGGRVEADYDAADLTEAARALVAELTQIRLAVAEPDQQTGWEPGFASQMHRAALAALDRLTANAADAGATDPAGQWRSGQLLAGRGVIDAAEHLVFRHAGDDDQISHAATWCPAVIVPMLRTKRHVLAQHAPDARGCCPSGAAWPCDICRAHLAGVPGIPSALTDLRQNTT